MSAFFGENDLPDGLISVFERSVISLSIADFTKPDCPLIGINTRFCDLSGYGPDEILGRNCRFLQPADGAGPVRTRMRAYLADPDARDERFLIANMRRNGTPFLNLVYMTKLTRAGKVVTVLGAQFSIMGKSRSDAELYDRALAEDLHQLKMTRNEDSLTMLGSFEALASAHSIIAQARMN